MGFAHAATRSLAVLQARFGGETDGSETGAGTGGESTSQATILGVRKAESMRSSLAEG
jgi:hypothetical protein